MRAQRRRFVVEVKRGTSRASFISTDAAAQKFSSAEDALFGQKSGADPALAAAKGASAPASLGRVLRDLQEPPAPVPEIPPPTRRGRKPGSKNKPKPMSATPLPSPQVRRRRHVTTHALADDHPGLGTTPAFAPKPPPIESSRPAEAFPATATATATASPGHRTRLRDRSTIIKRYVLGTEPAPGQSGWTRALRSRRAAARGPIAADGLGGR